MNNNGTPHDDKRAVPQSDTESGDDNFYKLTLFISGNTRNSAHALVNVRKICEQHLSNNYSLEVIDVSVFPEIAKQANLIGVPALLKHRPLPRQHFIGDMSNVDLVLTKFGIRANTTAG